MFASSYMNLFLIRHGESAAQVGMETGSDSHLTERGVLQATMAGESLRNINFDVSVVSPLNRTCETFHSLNLSHPGELVYDANLVENGSQNEAPLEARLYEMRYRAFRYASTGKNNVLFVSHVKFLSDFLAIMFAGEFSMRLKKSFFCRLGNCRMGLLRIPRDPGCFTVLSGWNISAKEVADMIDPNRCGDILPPAKF